MPIKEAVSGRRSVFSDVVFGAMANSHWIGSVPAGTKKLEKGHGVQIGDFWSW